jgi:hypothetical protein
MLSQYATAMFQFRLDNTEYISHKWWWPLPGKQNPVETERPDEFKYRGK